MSRRTVTYGMAKSDTVRVENHLASVFILPPVDLYPVGIRLLPGLNTVPRKYLETLESLEKHTFKKVPRLVTEDGRTLQIVDTVFDKTLTPGIDLIADLTTTKVLRVTSNGRSYGPRLSIYQDALEDRPDGPPPPASLPANPKAAKAIIESCEDKTVLERWEASSRGEIASLVRAKLASL